MNFTKEDFWTFIMGLGATLLVVLASALIEVSDITDIEVWARGLVIGLVTATGRYLRTYLVERGTPNA